MANFIVVFRRGQKENPYRLNADNVLIYEETKSGHSLVTLVGGGQIDVDHGVDDLDRMFLAAGCLVIFQQW